MKKIKKNYSNEVANAQYHAEGYWDYYTAVGKGIVGTAGGSSACGGAAGAYYAMNGNPIQDIKDWLIMKGYIK